MTSKLPPYPTEYLEISFVEEQLNEYVPEEIENSQNLPFADSNIYNSLLKSSAYLTDGNDVKTVISICLDIKDSGIQYEPGDTFGILPQNNQDEVDTLIIRLNYTSVANKVYKLRIKENDGKKKFKIPAHIPARSTIRKLLLNNLDIRSVPKKAFLRVLSKYTSSEVDLKTVNEICSVHYIKFITEESYTLLDVLNKFPSCFPPLNILLEHLPRLLPRPYSVACSPFSTTMPYSELHFVFPLSYLPNACEGICTGWLNNKIKNLLQNNHKLDCSNISETGSIKVPLYRRKSNNFKLPEQIRTNVIMISSGTGIAPFIGFLQHLEIQKTNNKIILTNSTEIWLFYGCKYSDRDFLFKNDLERFVTTGVLNKLFVSFSRENSDIKYVQDSIAKNANTFVGMLENSIIYVCGGAQMSKSVCETIVNCLIKVKSMNNSEALAFVNDLKKQYKYIEDVWS